MNPSTRMHECIKPSPGKGVAVKWSRWLAQVAATVSAAMGRRIAPPFPRVCAGS